MNATPTIPVAPDELLARLAAHRTLSVAPRAELEWLASHGEVKRYPVGAVPVPAAEPIVDMAVIFSGVLAIYVERGSGRRKVLEWRAGDVSGLLPYSRLVYSPGEGVIEDAAEVFVVSGGHFPEMIRVCPVITAELVHVMLDRARHFTSTDMQDEKMMSLGRLAAGLAHELNNPASAAARSAELLGDALADADSAAHVLGAAGLDEAQWRLVDDTRGRCASGPTTGVSSPLERADREDEIALWLERHRGSVGLAPALADSRVTLADLDAVAGSLNPAALDATLHWIASACLTRSLAGDVLRATRRIHKLVTAVKGFTHMDRATVAEPWSVADGLSDTVSVLAAKARAKAIAVTVDVPAVLPTVLAYGGELNQVWLNLLDNALDAAPEKGRIAVSAVAESDAVVVRVVDDGPGIPPEISARIFDPFFTTKPVGQGTGLGLDITRRIVRMHRGEIVVDSHPGRTEFRVTLPTAGVPGATLEHS